MNINFSSIFKSSIPFVLVISIAYILSSALYFTLPQNSVEMNVKENITLEYKRFNVKQFYKEEVVQLVAPVAVKKQEYQLLTSIKLKAVYAMGEEKGWIIIADNSSKTHMIEVGELFKGYTLSRVYMGYVIFTKNGKEYKVSLKDNKKLKYSVTKNQAKKVTTGTKQKARKSIKEITIGDDKVTVKRDYLNSYINNFDKIWKEISIREIKDSSGNINGFRVSGMSNKSVFKQLGLKRGDVIKAVNNVELKSYNDAFSIYKKINKVKNLQIKVLRKNREMELEYEIK